MVEGERVTVPETARLCRGRIGALQLECVARPYVIRQPDGGQQEMRVVTIMLINRRPQLTNRASDLTTIFQARVEVTCAEGLLPRADLSGLNDDDFDRRLADLQYRDVAEYAVGLNTSAGWSDDRKVHAAWTEPLPMAEVRRVAPNLAIGGVVWEMEKLAASAVDPETLRSALTALPLAYAEWIAEQDQTIGAIQGDRRREVSHILIERMRTAQDRIAAGIERLTIDERARRAFLAMNEAVARAARQRTANCRR